MFVSAAVSSSASLCFSSLDSLCPNNKNTTCSLEVARSNGLLALCLMFLCRCPLGGVVTCSLHSFSSDRSNTLNRSSFARDSMMIEEILAPTKDTVRSVLLHSTRLSCCKRDRDVFLPPGRNRGVTNGLRVYLNLRAFGGPLLLNGQELKQKV